MASHIFFIIYHTYLLSRFTKFYKKKNLVPKSNLKKVKVISANIYQYNQKFKRFKDLINKEKPDIFITIESNKDWEIAMRDLEIDYPYTEKVTLENTYGMHLYAKIPFQKVTTHYFVSDDIPSIEAHFTSDDKNDFVVFSVHPPPPSPTEEVTSKERDGDLMSIAKRAKEIKSPVLVIGDFNTVAWSRIAKLFIKNSGLIDGRSGRGILASYHAKYWFFRAPLDLVFHSPTIFLNELKVLEYIGSDHFPISTIFSVDISNRSQEKDVEIITKEEKKETVKLIKEGIKEKSANRDF
ncbi:endonuclease/exonuclease/phosphatase family protein [uncultured Dokdonia sp.]|uniref:endonuclease/exonuclease/phosphatase family protein n=1 Tax=uncultured Dokdonia sp. TaxID=575653 RepID=UPI002621E7C0|nr:endonuclease/exonuclease/phosphatase family protein [uncultured Dokdonia sp.]